MRIVDANEAQAISATSLGFVKSEVDFSADQVLIELVRRVAAVECPCAQGSLIKTVQKLINPFLPSENLRERILRIIEGLLDYGDLIEVFEDDYEAHRKLIGLGAPSAVAVSGNRLLLIGLTPGGTDPLPREFHHLRSMHNFAKILLVENTSVAMSRLYESGYLLITEGEWGSLPQALNASTLVAKYQKLFHDDVVVGSIDGLEILLPERRVTYWPDRWADKAFPNGDFVARRSKRYGDKAWCYVQISDGIPIGLVDLPTRDFRFRACDEAWHLQQAIDSVRGVPQQFRMTAESDLHTLFEFFSPVPQWAHRQWNSIGEQSSVKGALFSYLFPTSVALSVKHFAESRMWLVCQ